MNSLQRIITLNALIQLYISKHFKLHFLFRSDNIRASKQIHPVLRLNVCFHKLHIIVRKVFALLWMRKWIFYNFPAFFVICRISSNNTHIFGNKTIKPAFKRNSKMKIKWQMAIKHDVAAKLVISVMMVQIYRKNI